MTDEEFSIFEAAKAKGESAVHQALTEMPCGEFRLGTEIALNLAEGIRAASGPDTFADPAASGFLVGFSHHLAGALLLLAIHQPTHQPSN